MSDKQTRCPNCSTIYKVTVTQLTVAQGMVCCPKCHADFNALLNLHQPKAVQVKIPTPSQAHVRTEHAAIAAMTFETIFERKIESSNINLRTYLNNLTTFNSDPLTHFPSLNLSSRIGTGRNQDNSQKSVLYYVVWSCVNITLMMLLLFQILWFNPQILDRHPLLNTVFMTTCHVFNCETIDERYTYIELEKVKMVRIDRDKTQFSGTLLNQYSKILELPLLQVHLIKDDQVVASYMKPPSEYLIKSLHGITRIPTKSPFKFHFFINTAQKSFDSYKIEVISP